MYFSHENDFQIARTLAHVQSTFKEWMIRMSGQISIIFFKNNSAIKALQPFEFEYVASLVAPHSWFEYTKSDFCLRFLPPMNVIYVLHPKQQLHLKQIRHWVVSNAHQLVSNQANHRGQMKTNKINARWIFYRSIFICVFTSLTL